MHTVTVIVPTRDRIQLLATTLRTALWQEDVDFEVVVVDDGSSEDVRGVIGRFRDSRLRLIRHDGARGVCAARNTGADHARGEWLAFCDDDDLWAPDKLASQLAAARHTSRSWAYGGAIHVGLDLRVLAVKVPPSPERLMSAEPHWNVMPGGSSNVIVRADTFAAAGRWDPELINLADWDLWVRLARQGPPACVDRPVVGYRIHPGNASADTDLTLREFGVLRGRYGTKLDHAALHHYLAWVHLRNGRRRPAMAHFVRAAARGDALDVTRALARFARVRIGDKAPMVRQKWSSHDRAWIAEAEEWISRLRESGIRQDATVGST